MPPSYRYLSSSWRARWRFRWPHGGESGCLSVHDRLTMDEQGLVRDALAGDLDAFNRLVLAYQDIAFNLAYRMLSDDAAASDATQNAFLAAYRGLKSYRGGSFKAWILRMVTNSCYDELRRRQ